MAAPSKQLDQFVVRLPDGMRDRIKDAADANNRSMNAEIVATLEEKYPRPMRSDREIFTSMADSIDTAIRLMDEGSDIGEAMLSLIDAIEESISKGRNEHKGDESYISKLDEYSEKFSKLREKYSKA